MKSTIIHFFVHLLSQIVQLFHLIALIIYSTLEFFCSQSIGVKFFNKNDGLFLFIMLTLRLEAIEDVKFWL